MQSWHKQISWDDFIMPEEACVSKTTDENSGNGSLHPLTCGLCLHLVCHLAKMVNAMGKELILPEVPLIPPWNSSHGKKCEWPINAHFQGQLEEPFSAEVKPLWEHNEKSNSPVGAPYPLSGMLILTVTSHLSILFLVSMDHIFFWAFLWDSGFVTGPCLGSRRSKNLRKGWRFFMTGKADFLYVHCSLIH